MSSESAKTSSNSTPENVEKFSPPNETFKKKCDYCNLWIFGRETLERHTKSCKLYIKFFKQTLKGYQCLKCPEIRSERLKIYHHIKLNHLTGSEPKTKDTQVPATPSSALSKTDESQDLSKFYSKNKNGPGYQCLRCSEVRVEELSIKTHIKIKHLNKNELKIDEGLCDDSCGIL